MPGMEVRALAFDIFGTVVDWRGSIAEELAGLVADPAGFAHAWRDRYQPSLERVRSGEIGWTKLDDLHRASLDELLAEFGPAELGLPERERLVLAWHRLRPWPDSAAGLERLRGRFVLATLSNGNFGLLVDLTRQAGLRFDCILSAELVRAYKPDSRTYRMVPELLGLRPEQVMLVAAHPYDLRAAAGEGLRTAFVSRPLEWGPGAPPAEPDPSFDVAAEDLLDLADRLGA